MGYWVELSWLKGLDNLDTNFPVTVQPGKFCYDFLPDVSKSEMALQLAKEAEEAQEEERKIARLLRE